MTATTSLSPSTAKTVTSCLSHRLTSLAPIIGTLLASVPALKNYDGNDLTVAEHCQDGDELPLTSTALAGTIIGTLLASVPALKNHDGNDLTVAEHCQDGDELPLTSTDLAGTDH